MTEKNQDRTRDTGESGETYDQEMEANRTLGQAPKTASVQKSDSFARVWGKPV